MKFISFLFFNFIVIYEFAFFHFFNFLIILYYLGVQVEAYAFPHLGKTPQDRL